MALMMLSASPAGFPKLTDVIGGCCCWSCCCCSWRDFKNSETVGRFAAAVLVAAFVADDDMARKNERVEIGRSVEEMKQEVRCDAAIQKNATIQKNHTFDNRNIHIHTTLVYLLVRSSRVARKYTPTVVSVYAGLLCRTIEGKDKRSLDNRLQVSRSNRQITDTKTDTNTRTR